MPRSVRAPLILLLLVNAALAGRAEAQVLRGSVRSQSSSLPIAGATVTARDTAGTVLSLATTDSAGRWTMRVRRTEPFELRVRRLGFEMGSTRVRPQQLPDTLEFEFLLAEVAAIADEVRITATPSLNERRLTEAYRRGWKVYDPEIVAQFRERAADFASLARAVGAQGFYLPRGSGDCYRATRNNQCLSFVLDGQMLGPQAMILPSDIYFFAVLGASESRVQFGDRAPWGAIAIYTRSRLDRIPGGRSPR